jgi:hypothetical protein
MGDVSSSDSNHIDNIKSISARFIFDEEKKFATLEFKFDIEDLDMFEYTFVPEN